MSDGTVAVDVLLDLGEFEVTLNVWWKRIKGEFGPAWLPEHIVVAEAYVRIPGPGIVRIELSEEQAESWLANLVATKALMARLRDVWEWSTARAAYEKREHEQEATNA